MKIAYLAQRFNKASKETLNIANNIINDLRKKGFTLTLRQLYYQMVAHGVIPNKQSQYKRLGYILNKGRLAGLIDWEAIEDRTRFVRSENHWTDAQSILRSAAYSFAVDKWANQKYRPEVWIEKDALIGVLDSVCPNLDVPYFSCRGYVSASETWRAGQRFSRYIDQDQIPIIFHLGDHDPSGIDMTRDITERINIITMGNTGEQFQSNINMIRLGLSMDQIKELNPPPNPTKLTDVRAPDYIAKYGFESWELDALGPEYISDLVRTAVLAIRDEKRWDKDRREEEKTKARITEFAHNWKEEDDE